MSQTNKFRCYVALHFPEFELRPAKKKEKSLKNFQITTVDKLPTIDKADLCSEKIFEI